MIDGKQGHWILAGMGKKVLRPGGKELTVKLIHELKITKDDEVVEFAPGLGFTAALTLKNNPKSYTGIELDEEAAQLLRNNLKAPNVKIIAGNAAQSTLKEHSYTKVYGEAMLTMQADHRKIDIIREAGRLLKKGGYYGIHELCLIPDTIEEEKKAEIQKALAIAMRVNARPLTIREWSEIIEREGFKIVKTEINPMRLLELKRVFMDEGIFRSLKIFFNVLTHPEERKRILSVRKLFRKYYANLNGVVIVAEKK